MATLIRPSSTMFRSSATGRRSDPAAKRTIIAVVLLMLVSLVAAGKNFYDVLSVPRGASDGQIKRAYRKLALQYHPDKVTGDERHKAAAAKRFAEINTAYEALGTEETRRIYDRFGEEGLKQHQAQNSQGGGGGGAGGPMGGIFQHLFGGGFPGGNPFGFPGGDGAGGEAPTPRGADVHVDLDLTLEELFSGTTVKATRDKMVLAPAPGKRKCNCRQRVVTRQIGPGMYQQYTEDECDECDAVKLVREASEVEVTVEAGTKPGTEIRFFEEGEPEVDGDPGDLVFVVRQAPHARFRRVEDVEEVKRALRGGGGAGAGGDDRNKKDKKNKNSKGRRRRRRGPIPGMDGDDDAEDERTAIRESGGDDLAIAVSIPLVDALVGFSTTVAHLDGRKVPVSAKGVTRPGDVVTLVGEGMPRAPSRDDDDDEDEGDHGSSAKQKKEKKKGGARGDLHVTFTVDFPASLTEKQKSVVREHFKAPPRDEL